MKSPLAALPVIVAALACSHSAHADNDKFAITLSAFRPASTTEISANGDNVMGQRIRFEDTFDLAKDDVRPRMDGMFRMGDRHRLLFNYYNLKRSRSAYLDEDLHFNGEDFSIDTEVTGRFALSLATLSYEYALVETPTLTVGASIGAHWLDTKVSIKADDESQLDARTRASGGAPAIGLRFLATPGEHWRFGGTLQAFKADVGKVDGKFERAGVNVEYRFAQGVGVQLGYDWFRLRADYRKPQWNGSLDLRINGPTLGMTFAY
ncbi:MAG: hypothetical protein ABIY56_02700 [Dokdonella sp.]